MCIVIYVHVCVASSVIMKCCLPQEYDQQIRRDSFRKEELLQQQVFEQKQLPRQIKSECRKQLSELKKTMGLRRTPEEKEKIRKVSQSPMLELVRRKLCEVLKNEHF